MIIKQVSAWMPYAPSDSEPWNLRRVVHMHRRAGFAATWSELERDLHDGPQTSLDRLLNGHAHTIGVPADFESTAGVIGDAAVAANNPGRLKAWWLYRMVFSPDPLTERLTLFWHNHFATSNLKVNDVALMRGQNEIFRRHAKARFGELLPLAVKHPATLVWLDADSNRADHPNENLAREIMEVFTLGVGHYKETDVKEAARALTGWSIKRGEFRDEGRYHDDGEKVILGNSGRWRGGDLVRTLLAHPALPQRLAQRICELFMAEGAVDQGARESLVLGLRQNDLDIGWAVETVLRSQRFFADCNIANRIAGPVEFVVGMVRALEMFDPPPSTLMLSEWAANLGQDLFYPPNVFGWPGGRSWITSRSVIARRNFAAAVVNGSVRNPARPLDAMALAHLYEYAQDASTVEEFFGNLLLGSRRDSRQGLDQIGRGTLTPEVANRLLESVLASPEIQLM